MYTATAKRPIVKLSPELNVGHILQITVLVIGGFGAYSALKENQIVLGERFQASQIATTKEIELLKAKDIELTQRGNERYSEINNKLSSLGSTLNDINVGLGVLRGRAAESPVKR